MIKVLVVEDMDITREDILGLIDWEQHGFELLPSARNGRIGLEHALRYRPDIVLTDIKMPVMTGLDMMKEIREKFPGPNLSCLPHMRNLSMPRERWRWEHRRFS